MHSGPCIWVQATVTDTAEQPDPDAAIASIEQLDTPSNGDRREPLSQAIASRLRDAIIDGRLPPGMAIRQETLAMHLGTSRIPVREALRKLETEGMLTLVPHSGARVARLDLVEHVELYRIREALEPLAIAESAPRLSDDQLQELRDIAALIEDSRHDPPPRPAPRRRAHRLAASAARALPTSQTGASPASAA